MPWYFPWSDPIKKRACRYLLERYLGCYLEQKLTLDQLSIDLYKGTGCISDVALDVEALNESGEQYNLPVEIVDGYLGEVHISIPWKNLLTDNCFVEIRGLTLTVQPKTRDSTASVLESMTASMTSSIQMAQDVLSSEEPVVNEAPLDGVELFAKHIDAFFSRVKVRFLDTVLRFEHVPENANSGVGIEVRIKNIDFFDEAGVEKPLEQSETGEVLYEPAAFVTKGLHLEGVRFYCHEFPSDLRTFSRSLIELSSSRSGDEYRTAPMSPVSEAPSDMSGGSSFNGDSSSPILFAKLSGLQQVRTRLKQNDQIQGPKVDLELRCGSLVSFLTPRQFHVLLKVAEGILNPHTEDTSNLPGGGHAADKPMSAKDFEKIEQQLQSKWNYHEESRGLLQQGWSSQCLDGEDEFLPMGGRDSMTTSRTSDISSVSTSSELSSVTYPPRFKGILGPPQVENPLHRRRKKTRRSSSVCSSRSQLDDGVQTTRFTVSVSMMAVTLVHEDIMMPSMDVPGLPATATVHEMQVLAEDYFNKVGIPALPGYTKDFSSSRQQFENAYDSSHLRLLLSPLNIEGKEVVSPTKYSVSASISAGSLELVESLPKQVSPLGKSTVIEMIKFKHEQSSKGWGEYSAAEPDVKVHVSFTEPLVPSPSNCTKLMLQCTVGVLESEVDITLIDRLDSLIHPPELCYVKKTVFSQNVKTTSPRDVMEKEPGCSLELSLAAPKAAIVFRFPIPDLRPIHCMDRPPRWLRNVRREVAVFHLDQPTFKTSLDPLISKSSFDLSCRSACIEWKDSLDSEPVPLIRTEGEEDTEQMGFGLVRVLFHMYEEESSLAVEEEEEETNNRKTSEESDSFFPSITGSTQHPKIFDTQKVFYNNPPDTQQPSNSGECEELLIPGSKGDVCEWVEDTSRSCQFHLELHLPAVEIHLPDKKTYELLYNRLNSDLLLWEPSAPKLHNYGNKSPGVMQESVYQTFSTCKSGAYYESTSDSEEDNGMYYSIFDHQRLRSKRSQQSRCLRQSYFFFTIDAAQAVVTAYAPAMDKDGKETDEHGMIWVGMDDLGLAVVSGHNGDMNRGYISFTGRNATLGHRPVTAENGNPLRSGLDISQPSNLRTVIAASDLGMLPARDNNKDIITVSVAINRDQESRVKTFTVSGGIYGGCLQYKMETWTDTWLNQLLNFFDVLDYPVNGYEPFAVLTELHLHLWDCAIDYKPIYLPYHAVISLERLHISSNIAAGTNNSCLRFIAEECTLWLSDRQLVSPNLYKDHVCVAHLILFNLALRLHEGNDPKVPKHDLTIYNNKLCLRTCADSCRALAELLTYVAGEGDCAPSPNSSMTSVLSNQDENGNPPSVINKELTKDQMLEINTLMEDAMLEASSTQSNPQEPSKGCMTEPVELFFFPGENQRGTPDRQVGEVTTESLLSEVLEEVEKELQTHSDEEEFCILDNEAGTGIKSPSGQPVIRFLTSDPIALVDNHFKIPVGKGDLLRAPQHFPVPTSRYTLREVNVDWYVYGGRDFQSTPSDKDPAKNIECRRDEGSPKDRRRRRYSSGSRCSTPSGSPHTPSRPLLAYSPPTVTFNRGSLNEIRFSGEPMIIYTGSPPSSPSTPLACKSPKQRGGPFRRHDVQMQFKFDKVRFRYEIYPSNSQYASRQVLAIQDIEIVDRIATSSINKFLYQYSSENMPRQSTANILLVKAVHSRPDPNIPTEECTLKVSCLPLRLNIDQDAIFFLHDFFSLLSDGETQEVRTTKVPAPSPIITVQSQKNDEEEIEVQDDNKECDSPPTSPTYFRSVRFHPALPIRVDYQGKRVDWEQHGPIIGLIIGLAQLQCSQIQLREINYRQGIVGIERLFRQMAAEWLNDIKRNQLPSVLGGVGPMHTLIQFISGLKDLVWMPVEQYQKDGRIIRGIQRGASSFSTSSAYAAIELTTKFINTLQSCAETALDILCAGPSVKKGQATKRRYSTQPMDMREGISSAYQLMKQGLGETAEGLTRAASQEHQHKGAMGAVGGVMRQLPRTIMEPVILATQASSHVLGGARNQLKPDSRREEAMKWKKDDQTME